MRLLFASLLYVSLALGVIGLVLFLPLFAKLEDSGESSLKVQQAARIILYIHETFWPAVLLSFILICLLSIRTSHRIAGPLYRIVLVLESIRKGKLSKPVHGRKGDRLDAELEIVNRMTEELRLRVGEIQKAREDLHNSIVACSGVIRHASSEELALCMKDIQEKECRLEERVSYFKIE